ncbi:MAG: gliding motility-associated protein GldE [Bacteroidetes bacterium]|nr:gliding motility-associated protein GldE [Bacteroidota bacterium]
MESPDPEPGSYTLLNILGLIVAQISTPGVVLLGLFLLLLLIFSALLSGSEVAYFSLHGEKLNQLTETEHKSNKLVLALLAKPRTLLATVLIGNNVVNIAIIILSSILTDQILTFKIEWLQFLVQVVVVTFLIVLFGEVIPKIYANHYNIEMARAMAKPMTLLVNTLKPFSLLLVRSSRFLEKRINQNQQELTAKELNQAIDLTSDEGTSLDEKKILKGVVNFGNTTVKEIMRSRHDIVAYSSTTKFADLLKDISKDKYSRLPIYSESIDSIVGLLYIKDLLPHINQGNDFEWQELIRKPFFVPEIMKIDDLMREFQEKKVHMAIVVDEYGGTEGLATFEDVLEEIVGEINDEFDEAEIFYSRLDDSTVLFFGKTSLSDVRKVLNLEPDFFEEFKSEVESLGGLMNELAGEIPAQGQILNYKNLSFFVELVDNKRVERVKATISNLNDLEENTDQ